MNGPLEMTPWHVCLSLCQVSLGDPCGDGLAVVGGVGVGDYLELAPSVLPQRVGERRPGHDLPLGIAEVD